MAPRKYLFIGGTWDMEWHILPGSARHRVLVPVPVVPRLSAVLTSAPNPLLEPKVDYYHSEKFGEVHHDSELQVTAIVFVLDGIDLYLRATMVIQDKLMGHLGYVPGGPHRDV